MASKNVSPAVESAKDIRERENGNDVDTLKDGVRVRFVGVSATLLDEVTSRVKDPEIPMFYDEERKRNIPNESDPSYLRALQEAERQRGVAAMDAMILFGIEIIDGVPQSDGWLPKLKRLEKMGRLDLSGYDIEDPIDIEFLYKRYILGDANVLAKIGKVSGVAGEEIARAEKSFPGH